MIRPPGLPHSIPNRNGIFRMTPDLVAKFSRVACTRDQDRHSVHVPDTPNSKAEPAEFHQLWSAGRCPHDLLQNVPALWPLDGDIVKLIRRRLDPDAKPQFLALLPQPDPIIIFCPDPAKVVRAEPEDRAVIQHSACVITEGRVD